MSLFAAIQIVLAVMAGAFCVLGAWVHRLRLRRDRRRSLAHGWAATVVLGSGDGLDPASRALAELPRDLLAEVLQHLSSDTTGEARRRLQVVAQHAGLARHIERMSRRRSWHRRVQAAHLLMLLPDQGRERAALVADPHPFVRARAIESLLPDEVSDHVDDLLESLAHPSPAVRSAAQHALARGGASCVAPLVEALGSAQAGGLDPEIAVLVVQVAVELPDPRLADPLLGFAAHPDPRLRRLVAGSLGRGVFRSPGEPLSHLVEDVEPEVRAEAARSVGAGGVVELAPALGRLLSDGNWQVRRASGAALAELGPVGRLVLRCHLSDDDPFARDMAKHVLGQISGLTNRSHLADRWVAA